MTDASTDTSTDSSTHTASHESVMAGAGYYSANSRPQHVAAEVAYPYLIRAANEIPGPRSSVAAVIGDFGCAGGANEMEPMGLAIDGLRSRLPGTPVQVVHTDLPQNDFGPLFELLQGPGATSPAAPRCTRPSSAAPCTGRCSRRAR